MCLKIFTQCSCKSIYTFNCGRKKLNFDKFFLNYNEEDQAISVPTITHYNFNTKI